VATTEVLIKRAYPPDFVSAERGAVHASVGNLSIDPHRAVRTTRVVVFSNSLDGPRKDVCRSRSTFAYQGSTFATNT
jgi:hypothetical protein